MELTNYEEQIILLVRKIKPYGKLEVARNQNDSKLSVILTNPEKQVFILNGEEKIN